MFCSRGMQKELENRLCFIGCQRVINLVVGFACPKVSLAELLLGRLSCSIKTVYLLCGDCSNSNLLLIFQAYSSRTFKMQILPESQGNMLKTPKSICFFEIAVNPWAPDEVLNCWGHLFCRIEST